MNRYRNLVLLAMATGLFVTIACKSHDASSSSPIGAAVAAPAAQAPAKAKTARIIFVGKERACDCTKKSIDAGWEALQKALGTATKLPVERLQVDTQEDRVLPYRQQKPMMALPALYFVDAKDTVLEVLQGEVTEVEIAAVLKK